jgi:hypothetical protein
MRAAGGEDDAAAACHFFFSFLDHDFPNFAI